LTLAVLAGAYISLGAMLFIFISTHSSLGWGLTRFIGGIGFSMGLILIVVGGGELFTGNNLLAMAWASRLVTFREVVWNWTLVYFGNVVGCLLTVALVYLTEVNQLASEEIGRTALSIAEAKTTLSWVAIFARGILCNALVCVAVWMATGARSVVDKVVSIIFPISAFVTLGLEHSIANWFFLPYALALDSQATISIASVGQNLVASTLGNIMGGTLLVAAVYWVAYLRISDSNA
jgi:formate transporter